MVDDLVEMNEDIFFKKFICIFFKKVIRNRNVCKRKVEKLDSEDDDVIIVIKKEKKFIFNLMFQKIDGFDFKLKFKVEEDEIDVLFKLMCFVM